MQEELCSSCITRFTKIKVQTRTGVVVPFFVLLRFDTSKELKTMIQDKLGIPKNQQRLTFAGNEMDDILPLACYGIGERGMVIMESRAGDSSAGGASSSSGQV